MKVLRDLEELVSHQVIDKETALRIEQHYQSKKNSSTNRFFIVFGILGAILIGLGIWLIVAHNWDDLSRFTKTVFAFVPLLLGQMACAYSFIKKRESIAWKESTSAFLFFCIGICIALISQIYHIQGDEHEFILTWMLLSLPLIFIMDSSILSLLYIIGITNYGSMTGYGISGQSDGHLYWLLLIAILPYYYLLIRKFPNSLFTFFHHWAIPISLTSLFGIITKENAYWMISAYLSMFGLFLQIGPLLMKNNHWLSNGYKLIGTFGTLALIFFMSFYGILDVQFDQNSHTDDWLSSIEFLTSAVLLLLSWGLWIYRGWRQHFHWIYLAPLLIFMLTFFKTPNPTPIILVNLYIFILGVVSILEGLKKDQLSILNYGLSIITILIFCRFFDTDIPFVVKGIIFLVVGFGFFAANYYMLRKRKSHDI
ncbi:MAG: DUF2157 domain-containing protein [Saprospiraceae bacterium]